MRRRNKTDHCKVRRNELRLVSETREEEEEEEGGGGGGGGEEEEEEEKRRRREKEKKKKEKKKKKNGNPVNISRSLLWRNPEIRSEDPAL